MAEALQTGIHDRSTNMEQILHFAMERPNLYRIYNLESFKPTDSCVVAKMKLLGWRRCLRWMKCTEMCEWSDNLRSMALPDRRDRCAITQDKRTLLVWKWQLWDRGASVLRSLCIHEPEWRRALNDKTLRQAYCADLTKQTYCDSSWWSYSGVKRRYLPHIRIWWSERGEQLWSEGAKTILERLEGYKDTDGERIHWKHRTRILTLDFVLLQAIFRPGVPTGWHRQAWKKEIGNVSHLNTVS